ncbi:hypothetical protein ONZ51_g10511 [Trametes cubensis]|uniref:F5/8 type C domain-containing protein n=1 Tax=Trametes cubensis TaxID=1111947 RepID=A0AAD7TLY5_9APHY|nr:hypothetical protein ONZ51_g10511 [Trametes cubensis]
MTLSSTPPVCRHVYSTAYILSFPRDVGAGRSYVETRSSTDADKEVTAGYGSALFLGEEFLGTVTLGDIVLKEQSIGVAEFVIDSLTLRVLTGSSGLAPVGGWYPPFSTTRSPTAVSDANGLLTFDTDTTLLLIASGKLHTCIAVALCAQCVRTLHAYMDSDALALYKEATGAAADSATGLLKITQEQFDNFHIGDIAYEPNAQIWPLPLNAALDAQDADDTNPGMYYTGLWVPNGDSNAFGHHDTWTNQTGATVSFDFIGTQIKVFVTRSPVGTYLSKASFSIDGKQAEIWETREPVAAISYKNRIFTSKPLLPVLHRITVTNLGAIFRLDYMEYTVASIQTPPIVTAPSSTTAPSAQTHKCTSPSCPSFGLSPTRSSTSGIHGVHQNTTSTSHHLTRSPSSTLGGGTSATSDVGTASTSDSAASNMPSSTSGGLPSSSTAGGACDSDGNGACRTQASVPVTCGTGPSTSHTAMIVGIAVGATGGLAFLLSGLWWLRIRHRARQHALSYLAATPFTVQSPEPSVYFWKDRPPNSTPAAAQRRVQPLPDSLQQYAPSREEYDENLSRASSEHWAHSEPTEPTVAKHLALFRAHEASPRPVRYSDHSFGIAALSPSNAGHDLRAAETIAEAIPVKHLRIQSEGGGFHGDAPRVLEIRRLPVQPHPPRTLPTMSRSDRFVRPLPVPPTRRDDPVLASTAVSSNPHNPSHPRTLRRSRDGGIRLAGGRPGVRNWETRVWTSAVYDDAVVEVIRDSSTMPPSYAQYAHSSASGS